MKTAKFRAIMVVFMVGCLVAIIPSQRVGAQDWPIPFPEGDIEALHRLVTTLHLVFSG